jgi:hypothetical protein
MQTERPTQAGRAIVMIYYALALFTVCAGISTYAQEELPSYEGYSAEYWFHYRAPTTNQPGTRPDITRPRRQPPESLPQVVAFRNMGTNAIPFLREKLTNGNGGEQLTACGLLSLAFTNSRVDVPELWDILRHSKSTNMIGAAYVAIRRIGLDIPDAERQKLVATIPMARQYELSVRTNPALSIITTDTLQKQVLDVNETRQIRINAVQALEREKSPTNRAVFLTLCRDADEFIRSVAWRQLPPPDDLGD